MTIRNILVPVADRPECAVALGTAFRLAKSLGANVTGCQIRPHTDMAVKLPKELLRTQLQEREAKALSAAKLFERLAAEFELPLVKKPKGGSEPSVCWKEMVGDIPHIFPIMGRTADLIIVSRPKKKGGSLARQFVTEAMLNTGRPVFILPQRRVSAVGRNIAIAWDRGAEAARAVKLALPLLHQADQVTFLEATDEAKLGPKPKDMAQYLAWHGIRADAIKLKGNQAAEKLIEDCMAENELDLLVMGAYSRSRLQQIIFGGVTRYMIHDAQIPLFVMH